jgi:hypothetical protein
VVGYFGRIKVNYNGTKILLYNIHNYFLLEKLIALQLVKNSLLLTEPEGSLMCLQQLATGPYTLTAATCLPILLSLAILMTVKHDRMKEFTKWIINLP